MLRRFKKGLIIVCAITVLTLTGLFILIQIKAPHLITVSHDIQETLVSISLEQLAESRFITGLDSCENLYLDKNSLRVYVTNLNGIVHLLDGKSRNTLSVKKSLKLGEFCLGIDMGPDGAIYAGVSSYPTQEWIDLGGAIYRFDTELRNSLKITSEYPALNGLAFDKEGCCYFATSNFNFLQPKGSIYMMKVMSDGKYLKPKPVLRNIGLANGVHYNYKQNRIYITDTLESVSLFTPGESQADIIYRKTKYFESIDDMCTDSQGCLWMSDPFDSTVKYYNPDAKRLIRYDIKGIGQTSSCGIRIENGEEILYITEIKRKREPMSDVYDGRGLFIVPVKSLENAGKL